MFSTSLLNSILEPGSRTRHSMSFQPLSAGVTCTAAKSTTGTDKKNNKKNICWIFFFSLDTVGSVRYCLFSNHQRSAAVAQMDVAAAGWSSQSGLVVAQPARPGCCFTG